MKRRSFLQLVGLGSAAVPIVVNAKPEKLTVNPNKNKRRIKEVIAERVNGKLIAHPVYEDKIIRKVQYYDVRHDDEMTRFDITDGKAQWGIDVRGNGHNKHAIETLFKDAAKEVDINNLATLPIYPEQYINGKVSYLTYEEAIVG